jgi:hypothetical protein
LLVFIQLPANDRFHSSGSATLFTNVFYSNQERTQEDVSKRICLRITIAAMDNYPRIFSSPLITSPSIAMLLYGFNSYTFWRQFFNSPFNCHLLPRKTAELVHKSIDVVGFSLLGLPKMSQEELEAEVEKGWKTMMENPEFAELGVRHQFEEKSWFYTPNKASKFFAFCNLGKNGE